MGIIVIQSLLLNIFNLLQYPKGLGETVPELKEKLKEGQARFSKTKFTMLIPEVISQLESNQAIQHVVLFGIEVIYWSCDIHGLIVKDRLLTYLSLSQFWGGFCKCKSIEFLHRIFRNFVRILWHKMHITRKSRFHYFSRNYRSCTYDL